KGVAVGTLPLLPLESENRAFPPTSRTLRATVATEDFGIACRVGQHVLDHRLLTSIHEHVERLEVSATVFGPRRVTADNPFLSPEQRNRLDDLGLIREGLVTKPGDVLISVLQVRKSLDLSRVLDNPRLQSVSDESIYVQPAWAGARVTQSE